MSRGAVTCIPWEHKLLSNRVLRCSDAGERVMSHMNCCCIKFKIYCIHTLFIYLFCCTREQLGLRHISTKIVPNVLLRAIGCNRNINVILAVITSHSCSDSCSYQWDAYVKVNICITYSLQNPLPLSYDNTICQFFNNCVTCHAMSYHTKRYYYKSSKLVSWKIFFFFLLF